MGWSTTRQPTPTSQTPWLSDDRWARRALQHSPGDYTTADAYLLLASSYAQVGDSDRARQALNDALRLSKASANVRYPRRYFAFPGVYPGGLFGFPIEHLRPRLRLTFRRISTLAGARDVKEAFQSLPEICLPPSGAPLPTRGSLFGLRGARLPPGASSRGAPALAGERA